MALDGALSKISQQDYADREQLIVDLVGPSSYVNGGEPILPEFFPFRTGGILLEVAQGEDYTTKQSCKYDPSTATLKFFDAAGAEVLDTTDLSANTYRLVVVGR